ncbi:protein fam162a [Plakobranchus ocellatus]|uniref:Protein fam162a n=1 Tax=Plakobranchus ocellatus TaxID=259542 RepID=A0AAV3YD20_9GAST|nr:protein fam162a [Plakobranchus ocellatus]
MENVVSDPVTPGGHATHKPTPFQQKVLVWSKMYPSSDKVPERVTRSQMKKAMDLFRVRSSICMAALVFVFAAVMALIGRKQRQEGMSVTKIALEKRQH